MKPLRPMSSNQIAAEQAAIEAFLAARPSYDRGHVRDLAETAERRGLPFCADCADWHLTGMHNEPSTLVS